MRRATSSLRSAVLAIPASSIVNATTRRAVLARHRQHGVDLGAPGFEVNRVDDRAAGIVLQRGLEHFRLGRVDHERRLDRLGEPANELAHLLVFVGPLGQRAADVEHVRAALDLLARHEHDVVVAVLEQQTLDLARALRVDAFADDAAAAAAARGRRP